MKLLSRLFCFLPLCFQILPTEMLAQNAVKTFADKTEIRHSFFIAGPKFTGIIGENGEEIWKAEKSGARDGYVLPKGNILICWGDEVREYNGDKKVILKHKVSGEITEKVTLKD